MARKKIPEKTADRVFITSRRRCCICYGLNRDVSIKRGQIAHLDQNNQNSDFDNLAFLCLDHHDEYDSRTSQSRNLAIGEVKKYRAELYENVLPANEPSNSIDYNKLKQSETKNIIIETLEDNHGFISSLSILSFKVGISVAELENHLFELYDQKIIRIDRPRGKRKKTISLTDSYENIIMDTFLKQLEEHETIKTDLRFVSEESDIIDGVINTENNNYLIKVMLAPKTNNKDFVNKRLKSLIDFSAMPKYKGYRQVLLIGISNDTVVDNIDQNELEEDGVTIKFIILE